MESPSNVVGRALAVTWAAAAWELLLYGFSDHAVGRSAHAIAAHLLRDVTLLLPVVAVALILGDRGGRALARTRAAREQSLLKAALSAAAFALMLAPVALLRELATRWAASELARAVDDRFLCTLALSSAERAVMREASIVEVLRGAAQTVLTLVPAVVLASLLTSRWRVAVRRPVRVEG